MLNNRVDYKRFVWEFKNIVDLKNRNKRIIFLCIGTNRIIGDAFGPVVGSVLKDYYKHEDKIEIIGDLDNVVTYCNIKEIIYNKVNENNLIIVLDSALSTCDNIGKIFIQNRGLRYAESLKKQNRLIGDISIKAVVGENVNSISKNYQNLKSVSFKKIYEMSNIVSNGIIDVMNKI